MNFDHHPVWDWKCWKSKALKRTPPSLKKATTSCKTASCQYGSWDVLGLLEHHHHRMISYCFILLPIVRHTHHLRVPEFSPEILMKIVV